MTVSQPVSDPCDEGRPISRLMDVHGALEELFLRHQVALLRLDVEEAREAFGSYRGRLEQHMRVEDAFVIPVYERIGAWPRGGAPELYHREHGKILTWLERLALFLEELGFASPVREVIALLDRECAFKHLMEHHSVRERDFLYAVLDRELDKAERARLWGKIEAAPASMLP